MNVLSAGQTADQAGIDDIVYATCATALAHQLDLMVPWCPTISSLPGLSGHSRAYPPKHVLVGWTSTDGLSSCRLANPAVKVSNLDNSVTDKAFRLPAKAIAEHWLSKGHHVSTFELTWTPSGYEWARRTVSICYCCLEIRRLWKRHPWSRVVSGRSGTHGEIGGERLSVDLLPMGRSLKILMESNAIQIQVKQII